MNYKFHPAEEAVTACAVCKAEMCFKCSKDAFYYTEDNKPICLECSLAKAEDDLEKEKKFLKQQAIRNFIAVIVWVLGAIMCGNGQEVGLILVVSTPFISFGRALFSSKEESFWDKLQGIFFCALICPFYVVFVLFKDIRDKNKVAKKVKKIKLALGIRN